MAYTLGVDISHYQLRPDFGKLEADGVKLVFIKATQGMGVDPDFDWSRNEAEKRNMLWGAYPFLATSDTDTTIQHFITVVGKGSKAHACLDWEAPGVSGSIVERWIDPCDSELGAESLVYRGKYPPGVVTPKIASKPRWHAQYPSNPNGPPTVPMWDGNGVPDWSKECLIWQFTGNGRLAGIAPAIDEDRVLCPFELFSTWWTTGAWTDLGGIKTQVPAAPIVTPEIVARVLQRNSTGGDILTLQQRLIAAGQNIEADGDLGPETEQAMIAVFGQKVISPEAFANLK